MSNQSSGANKKKKRIPRKSGLTAAGTIPTALANIGEMPDEALVTQSVVEGLAGCSAATVWRRVKSGLLQPPIKIGRTSRWRLGPLRKALR